MTDEPEAPADAPAPIPDTSPRPTEIEDEPGVTLHNGERFATGGL